MEDGNPATIVAPVEPAATPPTVIGSPEVGAPPTSAPDEVEG